MRKITENAWAVVMFDGFLPTFNVEGKMREVLQIHAKKSAADEMAKSVNEHNPNPEEKLWSAVPCTITYEIEDN